MVAAVIIAATLIWLPAYRWFFLISIGIGIVIAGALFLWNKFRPVKDEDVETNAHWDRVNARESNID